MDVSQSAATENAQAAQFVPPPASTGQTGTAQQDSQQASIARSDGQESKSDSVEISQQGKVASLTGQENGFSDSSEQTSTNSQGSGQEDSGGSGFSFLQSPVFEKSDQGADEEPSPLHVDVTKNISFSFDSDSGALSLSVSNKDGDVIREVPSEQFTKVQQKISQTIDDFLSRHELSGGGAIDEEA